MRGAQVQHEWPRREGWRELDRSLSEGLVSMGEENTEQAAVGCPSARYGFAPDEQACDVCEAGQRKGGGRRDVMTGGASTYRCM